MLPEGMTAVVHKDSYPVPPIFGLLQKKGGLEEKMMYNTYNMGLGMVLAVDAADAQQTVSALQEAGEQAYLAGEVTAGSEGVVIQ